MGTLQHLISHTKHIYHIYIIQNNPAAMASTITLTLLISCLVASALSFSPYMMGGYGGYGGMMGGMYGGYGGMMGGMYGGYGMPGMMGGLGYGGMGAMGYGMGYGMGGMGMGMGRMF